MTWRKCEKIRWAKTKTNVNQTVWGCSLIETLYRI